MENFSLLNFSRLSSTVSTSSESSVPNPSSRKKNSIGLSDFAQIYVESENASERDTRKVSPPESVFTLRSAPPFLLSVTKNSPSYARP